jgi:tellurite resistance-related uncharacterized protein
MKKNKSKKEVTRTVRFTLEEWEHITKSADECGMKVGTYIQMMVVQGEIHNYDFDNNKIYMQLFKAVEELHKIGVNINQIAHKVNVTNKVYQADISMLQKRFNSLERDYTKLVNSLQEYISTFVETINDLKRK